MTDDKASWKKNGARMKKARRAAKLTQDEVAKKAGISTNHYAQLERGEKDTTLETFEDIIDALGASSKDILGK